MQIIRTPVAAPIGADDLILDIETTGLSREHSHVFLIGTQSASELVQWMSDTDDEEGALLEAALPTLSDRRVVTFNGDGFDLPFLSARALGHGLALPPYESVDLYAFLRAHRAFFRYPDLKLQTIEAQEGLLRDHGPSGAEVAAWASQRRHADVAEKLLAHNAADVRATAALLPAYARWQETLHIPAPDAMLEELLIHGDHATATYLTKEAAMPEVFFTTSFGTVEWRAKALIVDVPVHRIPFEGETRIAAVSPSYQRDPATPPLPAPFLTLHEPAGHVASAVHAILRDLLPADFQS
ncbi:MAG: ribonuclease H-like domain-containing protein [Peptoniphilaceae bacterium]|nr:ribonuclease H-like domain-containing protein [Peptoniphilaceae bacterium]MDY6085449.1 ribonuclease H-like domain-containing protein [Peptoniphilaceae bacterium]